MDVIVATGNPDKIKEFERIFSPLGIGVVAQKSLLPDLEVDETGKTFAENAFLKAQAVHHLTGKAVVADDSGLCIDALDGAPGVYSARYGGADLPYNKKIEKLLQDMGCLSVDLRTARFVAHICFIGEDGERTDFEETCEGYIGAQPKGSNGFGYDPVFMVGQKSFAELSGEEKDVLSHRGKALRKLAEYLQQKYHQAQ